MLGNIVDHRTDRLNPHVGAVFEPSIHDDQRRGGEPFFDWDATANSDAYFVVAWRYGITLREAILRAERDWPSQSPPISTTAARRRPGEDGRGRAERGAPVRRYMIVPLSD